MFERIIIEQNWFNKSKTKPSTYKHNPVSAQIILKTLYQNTLSVKTLSAKSDEFILADEQF